MKKYNVTISETRSKTVEVIAENEKQAEQKGYCKYSVCGLMDAEVSNVQINVLDLDECAEPYMCEICGEDESEYTLGRNDENGKREEIYVCAHCDTLFSCCCDCGIAMFDGEDTVITDVDGDIICIPCFKKRYGIDELKGYAEDLKNCSLIGNQMKEILKCIGNIGGSEDEIENMEEIKKLVKESWDIMRDCDDEDEMWYIDDVNCMYDICFVD